MHEIKLIENLVTILEKEVDSPKVGDVKTVHLEVGKLRYIVPDIMESCFEHVPKSDKLKNAKIKIEVLPVKVKCSDCEEEQVVENGEYCCRKCSSDRTDIISGNEFVLKGIEW